jgi:hypothetical protein
MKPGLAESMLRGKKTGALAALFFIAVSVILFWPALLLRRMLYGYDTLALTMSLNAEVLKSLAAHQCPLWMPDVLGGMPCIASCNLNVLYPSYLFGSCLAGLSLGTLNGLDAALHVALAGTGMFFFLRRLDRSRSAALLGGFFFAISGSEVSQIYAGYYCFMEGIALVPWAFWAAHKGARERSWFAWGLCGMVFALQIVAQATQLFVYTLFAVALFSLSGAWNAGPREAPLKAARRRWGGRLPALQGLGLALALAFVLAAPQIWLTLQYLPLAARDGWTHAQFLEGSIGLSEALTWLVPGFFGWYSPTYHGAMALNLTSEYFGLLPWALAAGALSALWRVDAKVRWMAALALTTFFFAQGRWTPFYSLFQHVPILAGFRIWSRILFLLTFAVCVLAAFGWDALRAAPSRAGALRGARIFLGLTLAAAALAFWAAPGRAAADVQRVLTYTNLKVDPGLMADLLATLGRDSALTTLTLVPVLLALLWLAAKRPGTAVALVLALGFHAFDESQMTTRFVTYMDPAGAVGHPHFTAPPPPPPGLEPWRIFDSDISFPNNNVFLGYENLSGRESVPLRSYQEMQNAMRNRGNDWASLMNERYLFVHSQRGSSAPGDRVGIYQNRGVFPRAWLVGRSVKVSGDGQAYSLLADPGFHPRTEVALDVDAGLPGSPPQGGVTWLERSPQAFSLAVSTDAEAALVVSDFWYPSWKASVDGRDSPVLKADGGLQAVLLGAGKHRVDFRFDAGLFYDALAACLAGLVFLFGLRRFDSPHP